MSNPTEKKSILIRADAGGELGTGHVMRMIALAQAFLRRNGKATIATVRCPQSIIDRIKSHGIAHCTIQTSTPGSLEDADLTLKITTETGATWLITDGYHFDYAYQLRIKSSGIRLLCTDDHGYSDRWCCDAILNQNLDSEVERKYVNDISDSTQLLGNSFCLLREEFRNAARQKKDWKSIDRLLVTLGGSDPENITESLLKLLTKVSSRKLTIRVLVGADNMHADQLTKIESQHEIIIIRNALNMPEQMAWADGIISAGGSTCWEWLKCGLPGAVVTIADNQIPIVRALADSRRAALSLGWEKDFDSVQICASLSEWLHDPNSVIDRNSAQTLIDGKGADRLAALFDGKLRISIITAASSWLLDQMDSFLHNLEISGHVVQVTSSPDCLSGGDLLLILSYWGLLDNDTLCQYCHNLVVHESALPSGKGWSPMTWQILEGKSEIPVTLFEAVEKVDAGPIYGSDFVFLQGHELVDEIRTLQAKASFDLCQNFILNYPSIITAKKNQSGKDSFYPRRIPADSRLDPEKSIAEQFNLLRVVDNDSYPAFFEFKGQRYVLKIEKIHPNHLISSR